MEKEILQRIGSLEQEVKTLKTELETLRNAQKIELLAPARNLECGIEAIKHGADAVYIGAARFALSKRVAATANTTASK